MNYDGIGLVWFRFGIDLVSFGVWVFCWSSVFRQMGFENIYSIVAQTSTHDGNAFGKISECRAWWFWKWFVRIGFRKKHDCCEPLLLLVFGWFGWRKEGPDLLGLESSKRKNKLEKRRPRRVFFRFYGSTEWGQEIKSYGLLWTRALQYQHS